MRSWLLAELLITSPVELLVTSLLSSWLLVTSRVELLVASVGLALHDWQPVHIFALRLVAGGLG